MAKRKTFEVAELLHRVNHINKTSTCSGETRQGWNYLLEFVLQHTENYEGYGYLRSEDLLGNALGSTPGVDFQYADGSPVPKKEGPYAKMVMLAGGAPGEPEGVVRVFPDESRRVYYIHRRLHKAYDKFITKKINGRKA